MAKRIKVEIEVVPVAGKTTTKRVTLEASGASLSEVLQKAGIDSAGKEIRVDGKPVTDLNTHITAKSQLEAREQAPPPEVRVTATERPQSS